MSDIRAYEKKMRALCYLWDWAKKIKKHCVACGIEVNVCMIFENQQEPVVEEISFFLPKLIEIEDVVRPVVYSVVSVYAKNCTVVLMCWVCHQKFSKNFKTLLTKIGMPKITLITARSWE